MQEQDRNRVISENIFNNSCTSEGERELSTILSEDMAMMIIFLNINTADQSEGHGVDKEAESLNARSDQDPVL